MSDSPPDAPTSARDEPAGSALEPWADRYTDVLLRAFRLKRWLRDALLQEDTYADLRFDHLDDTLAFVIPRYAEGSSRIVGVDPDVYLHHSTEEIAGALSGRRWTDRGAETGLRIRRVEGRPVCEPWAPEVEEAWFPDPAGGWFVAYRSEEPGEGEAGALVLEGETWSARGPTSDRDPRSYERAELEAWIPSPGDAGGGVRGDG